MSRLPISPPRGALALAFVCLAAAAPRAGVAAVPPPLRLDRLPIPDSAQVPNLSVIPPRVPGFPRGGVLISWCESRGDETVLRCAAWDGARLSRVSTAARSSRMLASWADAPGVAVGAASAGWPWIAHWSDERDGAEEAADISLAASLDGGATWSPPLVPYAETAPAERGFAAIAAVGGDAGRVYWLDARHRPFEGRTPALTAGPGEAERPGTELRVADLGIGTDSTGLPRLRVLVDRVLDTRTCDCCPLGVATWEGSPRAQVFYRDRSAAELRDISAATERPDAETRVTPFSGDGWRIEGCPVNGPAVAGVRAHGRDAALVVWFTSAADSPRVYAALADSAGARVGKALLLDEGDRVAGRPSLAAWDDSTAIAAWLERDGKAATWRIVRLSLSRGRLSASPLPGLAAMRLPSPRTVARVAAWDGRLVLAWTEAGAKGEVGRVASVRLAGVAASSAPGTRRRAVRRR